MKWSEATPTTNVETLHPGREATTSFLPLFTLPLSFIFRLPHRFVACCSIVFLGFRRLFPTFCTHVKHTILKTNECFKVLPGTSRPKSPRREVIRSCECAGVVYPTLLVVISISYPKA